MVVAEEVTVVVVAAEVSAVAVEAAEEVAEEGLAVADTGHRKDHQSTSKRWVHACTPSRESYCAAAQTSSTFPISMHQSSE